MDTIPIVIFHIGDQEYFQKCVAINAKRNKVYVIGDDSNKDLFKSNPNVTFVHVSELYSEEWEDFKKHYLHNDVTVNIKIMYLWFSCIFYLKRFFIKYGYSYICHVDSDCIVLENVNKIFDKRKALSYSLQLEEELRNPYHMVGSIHSGLINLDFCNKFIELCFDIYKTKTKFSLIDKKIQWHKMNNVCGGICNMTLFYLLYSEKLVKDVVDLNELIYIDNEPCTFDHQLSGEYGYLGCNTYKKTNNIKTIIKHNNKWYFETQRYNDKIRTLSIHFQGYDKAILEKLNVNEW
jgi:hypothetical protein